MLIIYRYNERHAERFLGHLDIRESQKLGRYERNK
jgi:hypothetical protein